MSVYHSGEMTICYASDNSFFPEAYACHGTLGNKIKALIKSQGGHVINQELSWNEVGNI